MNFAEKLCFVLTAAYGLASVVLSIIVALVWIVCFERKSLSSCGLLTLRLLPCAGSLFLTFVVVLPVFLVNEPKRATESMGPLLLVIAAFTLAEIGAALVRGWRGWMNAASLLRLRIEKNCLIAGRSVDIMNLPQAMVAVIGIWRPRIVVEKAVFAACSDEEFREVIGHEAAHISSRDNLKLFLAVASPDILAWTPVGEALVRRWRAAVEYDADLMATGSDRRKRIALASALIKVARLSAVKSHFATLYMPVAMDDVDGRVRRLLTPLTRPPPAVRWKMMLACALLIALGVVPLYGLMQDLIEGLVAFGR